MSSSFDDVDQLLLEEWHPDYWSDDRVLHAEQLLEALSDLAWGELEAVVRNRPPHWRRQLADALVVGWPRAQRLLEHLVADDDSEVALAAAGSLSGSHG